MENFTAKDYDIILGDTMGEMQMWLATADVVFIGGSLVQVGGHNPLEATLFGVPVVSGPHMYNFDDMVTELSNEELLFVSDDQEVMKSKVKELLLEKQEGDSFDGYKHRAESFMQQHQGVTARLLNIFIEVL